MHSTPLLHPTIERTLKSIILKDLTNKGRPNWDRPHTEAVVHWMTVLLEKLHKPHLNSKILLTAAYAHDWGYVGLFTPGKQARIEEILPKKKLHMMRGAQLIERLLYQRLSSQFTEAEIIRVAHLVSVHDRVRELKDEDELLLMEADTLGMLDSQRVPPTMDPQAEKEFLHHSIHTLRLPRFVHAEALLIAEELLEKRNR